MSGFVKRLRTVDTVNPAGGIDPAKSPNVGQYGWTSYDAGNVNQIIEYVDLCKKYAEAASQSSEYIEGKIVELEAFMKYVENAYEEIKPIYDDIIPMYADIISRHADIKVRHEDIIAKHSEVEDWHYDVNVMTEETEANAAKALTSQLLAGQSEQGAEGWYDKSYELYEELQKGNVYRGTWNPHTMAYPAHGDTNSTWDVTLNEGELEYVWNGTRWFWGDRLVYVKTTNTYQQIESGTTVNSVNGKKGAVVLNADDVKAVPVTRTVNGKVLSADISITSTDTNSVPTSRRVNNKVLDADIVLTSDDVHAVPLDRKINNKLLSSDVTLTPADVGAISRNGDTLPQGSTIREHVNGELNIIGNINGFFGGKSGGFLVANAYYDGSWKKHNNAVASGILRVTSNSFELRTSAAGAADPTQNIYKVYHEGFKPTTADIGALPITGGTVNGDLTVNGNFHARNAVLVNTANVIGVDGSIARFGDASYSRGFRIAAKDGNLTVNPSSSTSYRVYHQGFKPSAADVGAITKSGDTNVGGLNFANDKKLIFNTTQTATGFIAVGSTDLIGINNRPDAGGAYIGGFDSCYLRTGNATINPSFHKGSTRYFLYHEGFKPTATDIQVIDPRTKKEETLMEVLLTMKAELDNLKEELLITKEKLNEFILK
ncbi:MAG: hypothetical protein ACRC6V_17820 [Bacteroidales bacterium]